MGVMSVEGVRKFFVKISLKNIPISMRILMISFVILQFVDVILSHYVINIMGGYEFNILLEKIVYSGLVPMFFFKLFMCILIVSGVCYIFPLIKSPTQRYTVAGVYSGLVLFYMIVTLWNFKELYRTVT